MSAPGATAELAHALAGRILAARAPGRRAFVVGMAAPQGAGKSTVAAALADRLGQAGLTSAILSLDDLYLTRARRRRLAAEVHPLLAVRGPPGTHDIALGHATLDALATAGRVCMPRFDKARDDRRPPEAADAVDAPVDVVVFEGWCLGALPQTPGELARPINALEREQDPDAVWRSFVNEALAGPYPPLFARVDFLIRLEAPSFEVVVDWRRQQEHALAARLHRGGGDARAMSDEEVAEFCAYFERLTRHMAGGGTRAADVRVILDAERRASIAAG